MDNKQEELLWEELARENNHIHSDPHDTKIDQIISEVSVVKGDHVVQEISNKLSDIAVEKCHEIGKQLLKTVKTFYQFPRTTQEEEDFWYEEITENHGITHQDQINYIKDLFRGVIEQNHEKRKVEEVKEKRDLSLEQQKNIVKKYGTTELMSAYAHIARAERGDADIFWEQQKKQIDRVEKLQETSLNNVMQVLKRVIEEIYVAHVLKKSQTQIAEKYLQIDHANENNVQVFWERVKEKTREYCPHAPTDLLDKELAKIQKEVEKKSVLEKEKAEKPRAIEQKTIDTQKENEQLQILERELRDARQLCFEKKKQQETAWTKIKAFFNVDPQEHADIRFVQNEYEKAYQRYRAARIEQSMHVMGMQQKEINEVVRVLDIVEAKERFDLNVRIKAQEAGVGATRMLENVSRWCSGIPKLVRHGLAAAILVGGTLMSSSVADHKEPMVSSATIQHQMEHVDAGALKKDVDAVVQESGVDADRFVKESDARNEIIDNGKIEIIERSVQLTIDEKNEGIEAALAEYLQKDHRKMLKVEKKTAAQAAHIIVQKYAKEHQSVDVDATWIGSRIIVDYTPSDLIGRDDDISHIKDFSIVEISPKRIIADVKKESAIHGTSETKIHTQEEKIENTEPIKVDKVDEEKYEYGKDVENDQLEKGLHGSEKPKELHTFSHILENREAQQVIVGQVKEIFGEKMSPYDDPRAFRSMTVNDVLKGHTTMGRMQRLAQLIERAENVVDQDKLPSRDNTVGLYLITLYDVITKTVTEKDDQNDKEIVKNVFIS